jgi:hypothetical protein
VALDHQEQRSPSSRPCGSPQRRGRPSDPARRPAGRGESTKRGAQPRKSDWNQQYRKCSKIGPRTLTPAAQLRRATVESAFTVPETCFAQVPDLHHASPLGSTGLENGPAFGSRQHLSAAALHGTGGEAGRTGHLGPRLQTPPRICSEAMSTHSDSPPTGPTPANTSRAERLTPQYSRAVGPAP